MYTCVHKYIVSCSYSYSGLQWVLACTENSYVGVFEVLMSVSWLPVTCYIVIQ